MSNPNQVGFFIDTTKCVGCKTCVVACKDKNQLEVGRNFRRVYDMENGTYPKPKLWHLSISCNHCDAPACVINCPTTAMHKRPEDGVVLVDHTKCVGCQYCTWACRLEELTSELQSLMRISYAVFCLKNNKRKKQQEQ